MLTLRLLRAVLPAWEAGHNEEEQEELVDRMFRLLGRVLVLCSSPFIQPYKTGRCYIVAPITMYIYASIHYMGSPSHYI